MIASLEEVKELLKKPYPLIIAARRETLEKLPAGNWIGGTVPFLIQDQGETPSEDHLDVTVIPLSVKNARLKAYNLNNIHLLKHDGFTGGFSLVIIPAESDIHHSYAMNSRDYPVKKDSCLAGWIAGYPLSESEEGWAVFGPRKSFLKDRAVAIHCELKPEFKGRLKTVNVFQPGKGAILEFPESGFKVKEVIIEGERKSFAEYIKENQIDIKQPLIAVDEKEKENVSFKQVLDDEVHLYAPVFNYKQYRLASQENEYHRHFMEQIAEENPTGEILFSCNCILNYSYDDLTGKDMGDLGGPVTFGEIAGNLLNQTYVSMIIEKI